MGDNLPKKLILNLKQAANIGIFCETGTYKAKTTRWAAPYFGRVYTIEAYEPRYDKNREALLGYDNVTPILGDSGIVLGHLLTKHILTPAIFWLDAHYCGDGTAETISECPLLAELGHINKHIYSDDHIIMIDDARMFIGTPSDPHNPADWPRIHQFINNIGTGDRHVRIAHDMIVSVPKRYTGLLDQDWFK